MHLKEYTQAVFETLKNGADIQDTLKALQTYLKSRGLEKMYPRVLRGIVEKQRRHDKTRRPKVIVARESDLKKYADEITALVPHEDKKHFETTVDSRITGGYIFRAHGTQVDNSYKLKLLDAYYKITQDTK